MSPSPAVLLPYQRRWLSDSARVKVYEKSRRIGATWATGAHCVLEAGRGAMDCWYVSYNEDSAKEFILDCAKWCKRLNVAASAMQEIIVYEDEKGQLRGVRGFQITFPNNNKRITALTSSARNLRGKQGLVIIDEAAFHDDLAEVLKAAFALLVWGGSVWIMSTHNGVDNAFAELVNDVRDGKRDYSLHRTTIEDALEEGLYRRVCAVLRQPYDHDAERVWLQQLEREYGDGVREELYCEPSGGGAAYIGRPLIEDRMFDAPVLRISRSDAWAVAVSPHEREQEIAEWCSAVLDPLLHNLPRSQPHCFGFDFGRYSDRSVLAPFTLQQNLVRRAPFLVEMQNMPHNQQWQVIRHVGERLPNLFKAHLDATGNGSWVAEQALEHWGEGVIECENLSTKWYAENMPPFREAHERGTVAYPRDLDVRNDIGLIRRIDGVPMLPKVKIDAADKSKPKRHGDAAIALVLGYAASRAAETEHRRWATLSM